MIATAFDIVMFLGLFATISEWRRHRPMLSTLIACLLTLALTHAAVAQETQSDELAGDAARPEQAGPPDVADVRYGPHERNLLDIWKAPSAGATPLVIHIHGGGFRKGDKRAVRASLVKACLERGISVASINYRFAEHAPYPAAMLDGARAVQFLRSRAGDFNLNADAFAATGSSAGAAISLWLGLRDDMGDVTSDELTKRQSTRLQAIAVQEAQTTLDPRVIARIVNEETARFPTIPPLFGIPAERDALTATRFFPLFEESSAATHVSRDDPPVLLLYRRPTAPPAPGDTMTGIHHSQFGFYLKEKMDAVGATCIVKTRDDYVGDVEKAQERDLVEFLAEHLVVGE